MSTQPLVTLAALVTLSGTCLAQGVVTSEQFGYAGTVTRHSTLADAQSGSSVLDTIAVTDRDLYLSIADGDTSYADGNFAMGSWWHTIAPGGSLGSGNTTGNTGVGFMQLFDDDGSTDTGGSMNFGNFNGTYYQDFTLSASGENAGAADYGRFSAIDNVEDGGTWHSWAINLTATGLEGYDLGGGIIEANTDATGISGSITAIFEITEIDGTVAGANNGFYAIDLDLNMINWAFANSGDLTSTDYPVEASLFRTVPSPASAALLGLGGLVATRRRR